MSSEVILATTLGSSGLMRPKADDNWVLLRMTEGCWDWSSGDVGRVLILTSAKRSLTKGHFPPSVALLLLFGGAVENGIRVGVVPATFLAVLLPHLLEVWFLEHQCTVRS